MCDKINCINNDYAPVFQDIISSWYKENGRPFSWRQMELDGWKWLDLEMLLKKTRAETVEKYYDKFIYKYGEPAYVFNANYAELEIDLKPFGLYMQRCEAFKLIAENIINEHNGSTKHFLLNRPLEDIKHMGIYTYNAIMCFCYGFRKAIVDVNIARVFSRFFSINMPKDLRVNWVWCFAEKLLPEKSFIDYNYGLLDIGSIYCKKIPTCEQCPLCNNCPGAGYSSTEPNLGIGQ